MPGLNGTGPKGAGPATGRGFGPCGKGLGRLLWFGRCAGRRPGRGLGRFFGWDAPEDKQETEEELKEYKKALSKLS